MPASTIGSSILGGMAFRDKREANQRQQQQQERAQFNALDKERQTALFQDSQAVNTHLKNGQIDLARGVLQNRLGDLERLGGDPTDTNQIITLLNEDRVDEAMSILGSVEQVGIQQGYLNQAQSSATGATKLGTYTPSDYTVDTWSEFTKHGDPSKLVRYKKKINPKMSTKLEGELIKAQDASSNAGKSAREMELLADRFNDLDVGGGLQSTMSEALKDILGSQDEVTRIRKRYNSIRSSQATSNLPPGPASDKDIALALSGFPKENSNAKTIISFLKGQSKLERINEAYHFFKSDYFGKNKSAVGLLKAWKSKLSDKEFTSSIIGSENDNIKKALSEDQKAIEWAKNNPNDPRSQAILNRNKG